MENDGVKYGFSSKVFGNIDFELGEERGGIRDFLGKMGVKRRDVTVMNQVHSDEVREVLGKDKGRVIKECDGMFTKEVGLYLAVRCADCLPVLFYDEKKRVCGVVHVGRRGTYKKFLKKVIEAVCEKGIKVWELVFVFGPCICAKCYQVDERIACEFKKKFDVGIEGRNLDIGLINKNEILKMGAKEGNILEFEICTFEDEDFFSYRKGDEGEFVGLIGLTS